MDNHPIPQDVTGFQFRLIGDMTVKQFAYVAVGGILAVVFLYAPIPFLFRIPLMILGGGLGAALAFMPLEGRPLDVMVGYFIKALVTPNQWAYKKDGGTIPLYVYNSKPQTPTSPQTVSQKPDKVKKAKNIEKQQQLRAYLEMLHKHNLSPLEKRELEFMKKVLPDADIAYPTEKPSTQLTPPPQQTQQPVQNMQSPQPPQQQEEKKPPPTLSDNPQAAITPEEKNATLTLQENVLSQELDHAKKEETEEKDLVRRQEAHLHVTELQLQLAQIQKQKEQLEQELAALREQVAAGTGTPTQEQRQEQNQQNADSQVQSPQAPPEPQAAVRKIPAEMAKSLGLPHMPDVPNLILGIVKGPRGNVLSNILVEVKDKDGTPARAFRTNQLGQFASATPLSPGTYTIEFEDPKDQHLFDTIEIHANNEILMPIEVISHDEREELRKALFN